MPVEPPDGLSVHLPQMEAVTAPGQIGARDHREGQLIQVTEMEPMVRDQEAARRTVDLVRQRTDLQIFSLKRAAAPLDLTTDPIREILEVRRRVAHRSESSVHASYSDDQRLKSSV